MRATRSPSPRHRTAPWKYALLAAVGVIVLLPALNAAPIRDLGSLPAAPPSHVLGAVAGPTHSAARSGTYRSGAGGVPASVAETIVLANDTEIPGNFLANPASQPAGGAVYGQTAFVADTGSQNLSVVNESTDRVVGDIPVGVAPRSVFALTGQHVCSGVDYVQYGAVLFVPNSGSASDSITSVLVLSSSIQSPTTFGAGLFGRPYGIAYSNLACYLWVTEESSGTVAALTYEPPISGLGFAANLSVGSEPMGVWADQSNGEVFVANSGSDNISVISAPALKVTTSIALPPDNYPTAMCNASNGDLYVADGASGNVSVIDPATNTLLGQISLVPTTTASALGAISCGPGPEVMVANDASNTVIVLNSTTNSTLNLTVGTAPDGIVLDPSTGVALVASSADDNLSILSGATPRVTGQVTLETTPWGIASGPAGSLPCAGGGLDSGTMWVANASLDGLVLSQDAGACTGGPFGNTLGAVLTQGNCSAPNTLTGITAVASSPTSLFANAVYGGGAVHCNGIWMWTGSTARLVPTAGIPTSFAYDSANGIMYAAASPDWIYGVNSTGALVSTWSTGASTPYGICYDPTNADLYAVEVDPNGTWISVIRPGTGAFLANISTRLSSGGLAYDPATQELFASDFLNGLSVIDTATDRVVANVSLGLAPGPGAAVFDPADGDVYVVDSATNTVSIVNASSETLQQNLPVGQTPYGIAVNPDGGVWVTNRFSATVSVITVPGPLTVQLSPALLAFSGSSAFSLSASASLRGSSCGPTAYAYTAYPVSPAAVDFSSETGGQISGTTAPGLSFTNVTLLASCNGFTAEAHARIAVGYGPALASVSLGVSSSAVEYGGTVNLTAAPVCVGGSCPPTTFLAWSLSNYSLGRLNTSVGDRVRFTANSAAGTVTVTVEGSLSRFLAFNSTILTISAPPPPPPPALRMVAITPGSPIVTAGTSASLTAVPSCSGGGSCPGGTTYNWSLNRSLGALGSDTGSTVLFTAGSVPGVLLARVYATLGPNTVEGIDRITVQAAQTGSHPNNRTNATGSSGFPLLDLLVIGAVLAAVAAVAVLLRVRRRPKVPAAATPSSAPAPPAGGAP